jgi:hypothetical protein
MLTLIHKIMKPIYIIVLITVITVAACNQTQQHQQADEKTGTTGEVTNPLNDFGKRYATAWCSQQPDSVAAFFSTDGSLTVNNGTPAVGRAAIAKVAESFMTSFPDMIVAMDSLPVTANGIEFHWTLTGTNTGPNGTGKNVKISGVEHWQLDDKGLIKQSQGSFDADEYNKQLKYGADE